MKKGIIIFGICFVFLLFFTLPLSAQQNWRPGMRAPYALNLTPDQMAKIQEMRLEFQKESLSMWTELQNLNFELRALYLEDTGQEKIDAKLDQLDAMELELEKKWVVHQSQIRDLLTDEQKVMFDQWGGLGLSWGRMDGMGPGMGMDFGRGYGMGFGRGYGGGFGRGGGRGFGRGSGMGMGRGYYCPWFQQGRFNRFPNWRRDN